MSKLTQKDEQGNWCIRGLPWRDIYPGAVITRNTYERIYGASQKLMEYEDTGLTPDEINALRERDTAKEPEEIRDAFGDGRLICPNCRNSVINYFNRSRPPRFRMRHYRLDIQQDIKQGKFAWQKESRRSSAST